MTNEYITPAAVVNPLRDIDFDVSDPNGWYRYVAHISSRPVEPED